MTFIKKFVHHKNLLKKGNAEWGFLTQFIMQIGVIWLFVRDLLEVPKWWVIWVVPVCLVVKIALEYCLGWLWDNKKIYNAELEWKAERNPYFVAILRVVLKILKVVKEEKRKT